jgi:hypothetical protein
MSICELIRARTITLPIALDRLSKSGRNRPTVRLAVPQKGDGKCDGCSDNAANTDTVDEFQFNRMSKLYARNSPGAKKPSGKKSDVGYKHPQLGMGLVFSRGRCRVGGGTSRTLNTV